MTESTTNELHIVLYKHTKTGRNYWAYTSDITNATNAQDGQRMVLYFGRYKDSGKIGAFVREYTEFHEKFKMIP
jgi:hypothetical protein